MPRLRGGRELKLTATTAQNPGETLVALLDHGRADQAAFVSPELGRSVTYAQLGTHVEILTGRLSLAGIAKGDRVALALSNSAEFVELLLAVTALGAAAAPLNPAYTEDEFTFYLEDIAPRILLLPPNAPVAERAAAATGTPVIGVAQSDDGGPPRLLHGASEIVGGSAIGGGAPEDVAIILNTSGTTSRPKQVPLRQRNLMASTRTIASCYELGPEDVSFCVMPLFHVHGLVASTFAVLGSGGTVIVPSRFTPQRFWHQARRWRATWFSAAPTLHQMILGKDDGKGVPPSLRFVRSCSSALSIALMERAEGVYGVPVLEAYGMTEASHQMASNPLPPGRRAPGSVGTATGTEIGVVAPDGRLLPDGSPGEVVIRGPGVTSGYVNNPTANAEAFFDGWFRTGDWGVLRDNYLYLEGRIKEMILRGGENIAPAEIEAVLLRHPAVDEAVCFGVADDKYGEVPSAAVTLKGQADPPALIDFCREHLAAFKVPSTIHVLRAIPRTPTGKVQRRWVAALVAGQEQVR